jgi:RNase P subunit RPR2
MQVNPLTCYVSSARMPHPSACKVCGHPVFDAKNHDVPAPRAAKMFPTVTCKCGKPARVRCFNGVGIYWVECEDGHGRGRPA